MINTNNVIVIGNLTKDPDFLTTQSGTAVIKFAIANNNGQRNGQNQVSFFDCQAWGKTAENLQKYCFKGSKVAISGRLEQQRWTGKDGSKHAKVIINAASVEFLTPKNSDTPREQINNAQEIVDQPSPDQWANAENDEIPF